MKKFIIPEDLLRVAYNRTELEEDFDAYFDDTVGQEKTRPYYSPPSCMLKMLNKRVYEEELKEYIHFKEMASDAIKPISEIQKYFQEHYEKLTEELRAGLLAMCMEEQDHP